MIFAQHAPLTPWYMLIHTTTKLSAAGSLDVVLKQGYAARN